MFTSATTLVITGTCQLATGTALLNGTVVGTGPFTALGHYRVDCQLTY